MKIFKGVAVCSGVAVGEIFLHEKTSITIPCTKCEDTSAELLKVKQAAQKADAALLELYNKAHTSMGEAEAEIFDMHRLMLADQDFVDALNNKIQQEQWGALKAVSLAGEEFSCLFEQLDDPYMKERAADVRDVSSLLLKILSGTEQTKELSVPSIIVADDLSPSETIQMDKSKILAFVTRQGAATSHTAILARTMGVPSIVQSEIQIDKSIAGLQMAVDGFSGVCYLEPDTVTLEAMKVLKDKEARQKLECDAVRGLPSVTKSGKSIKIFANIGSNADINAVLENDAEGIGLFRSEFLYLGRKAPPGEELQFAAYKNVAEKMNGKKVIIRTLDIGADKQVDYLGLCHEENPALGYRAIRICLDREDLFQTQLRAICRASAFGSISVMFPMITSVWEIDECKKALKRAQDSLAAENIAFGKLEIGIMIETPAAVILRDELAKKVDFFSVGTNDLTQYTLAVDRQNALIEKYADPRHPALIKMLEMIVTSAHDNGIWAGVCGELAADLNMVDKFISMGFDELSVSPPQILPLRKAVRESLI